MCATCIKSQVDIAEQIPREYIIHFCRFCARYLQPPSYWVKAELETKELMILCMKKIRGLKDVHVADASWIWTEPHSKRLRLNLTVQKEVFESTVVEQSMEIEYVVQHQICDACQRVQSDITWKAVVQVRQKVVHKRTFYFLEQMILKYKMHENAINIKEMPDGIDVYFNHRSHALGFISFLQNVVPVTTKSAKQLISADLQSNISNYKFNFLADIAPVCRDDLICLPKSWHASSGGVGPLVLCYQVGTNIRLIDPLRLTPYDIVGSMFFKSPFRSLMHQSQLIEFVVMDIEPIHGTEMGKFQLADCEIARASDLGVNDVTFFTKTHLGKILHPGDSALGYDLSTAIVNDDAFDRYQISLGVAMPDVILVRKFYPRSDGRRGKRVFKLQRIAIEEDESVARARTHDTREEDYERFLEELEEDEEMRAKVTLYRNDAAVQGAGIFGDGEEDTEEYPQVALEELVSGMELQEDLQ
jgi:nonsense-mediated mRNA decay protein 3